MNHAVPWACVIVMFLLASTAVAGDIPKEAAPPPEVDPVSRLEIIYKRTDIIGKRLELGIREVIDSTLKNNFDIGIERISVPISELATTERRAEFDPVLGSLFTYRRTIEQAINVLQGAIIPQEREYDADFSLGQMLPTGGSYSFSFRNQRLRTNDIFVPLNPRYDVVIRLDVSQPLLRDFGIAINTKNIHQAENEIKIVRQNYRQQIMNALATAINTYWELIFTIMDLEVREVSLEQARQLLEENEAKFRAGTVPRTDVLQAEAGVAERTTDIILMKARIETVEDQLKRVTNIAAERGGDSWKLPVAPQTPPTVVDVPMNVEQSLELARGFRPDYRKFLYELKNRNIELSYTRNQLWPSLDLVFGGELAGIGGTPRPGSIIDPTAGRGYRSAFDNATSGDFYTVEVGLVLEIPLGNRKRRSAFRTAKLELAQTSLRFERLKQDIIVETRQAIRLLRTARAQISSTDVLRRAQWKKLQAERKRFAAGKITSFDVLVFQEQFARAQQRFIRSVIAYSQAFIELQRVQGTLLAHFNIVVTY
ncbi:MAG: TolC family protein [Planctomycetes bacterium]|nr:TolC family protein [Planctomycetota bacterium]